MQRPSFAALSLPHRANAGSIVVKGPTNLSGKIAMLRKAIGLAAVLLAAGMISGCNQNQQKSGEQKTTQQEFGRGGHHGGVRKACADDIAKYCANEDRKKRCLRDNIDKLSDTCKAALAQARGGRNRDKDNNNNNNNNNNKNDDDNND